MMMASKRPSATGVEDGASELGMEGSFDGSCMIPMAATGGGIRITMEMKR